ncbi:MAG: SDR family NAD(P)-dependent oxidoreductase [Opitutae bacterium]|nr:SDR family NAD(P)-dependent oxidoreductase [Opitutae bacterium]
MSAAPLSSRYRTAFVTGASTGLGHAFAEMLLGEGVEVWGTARDPRRLAPRERFHAVALELGDGAAAEQVFLETERAAGGFDIVVNNAGFGAFGGFAETDFALWQRQLEVMLVNTARLSHAALRGMLARKRGALVNISSLAAEFPMPYQATYNVVKSGLSALNESLMFETAGTGVIVIDFRPGDYRTDFEGAVTRPEKLPDAQQERVWAAFHRLMASGPAPAHAAGALRRALARGRSGTVRTGRFFQAVVSPFLARFGSLALRRRIVAKYFDL